MHLRTYKVMLVPNKKQQTRMFACAGMARFAYNWALAYQQKNYENGGKFVNKKELNKKFVELRHASELPDWIDMYSSHIPQQAIWDACDAFEHFFKHLSGYPKFKNKHRCNPSFYVSTCGIKFTDTHVVVEKLALSKRRNKQKFNYVRLAERGHIPTNAKYYNPRITFDGLHWRISVSVEVDDETEMPIGEGIGIDVGVKDLAICSDENTYGNINKTRRVRKLEKRKRKLQREISRKYRIKNAEVYGQKGVRYQKTKNIEKAEKRLLKLNRKIKNTRTNYVHQVTSQIINRKPKFVVVEDLNVSGMLKNKKLSKAIQNQCLRMFLQTLKYKCEWHNIEYVVADRYYPSSKLCSCCGNKKVDLKLSDRTYTCTKCGNTFDRDYNASKNLKNYYTLVH